VILLSPDFKLLFLDWLIIPESKPLLNPGCRDNRVGLILAPDRLSKVFKEKKAINNIKMFEYVKIKMCHLVSSKSTIFPQNFPLNQSSARSNLNFIYSSLTMLSLRTPSGGSGYLPSDNLFDRVEINPDSNGL